MPMSVMRWRNLMWSQALGALDQLEQIHRRAFAPERSQAGRMCWQPPVDMLETDSEILVLVALPGADLDDVLVRTEGDELVIVGQCIPPPEMRTAVIHRLELPQGMFERRLPLPAGSYGLLRRSAYNGCLLIALRKAPAGGAQP